MNFGDSARAKKKGFIAEYHDRQFKEYLGEYYYDADDNEHEDNEEEILNSDLQKNRKKRVIIYQLEPES